MSQQTCTLDLEVMRVRQLTADALFAGILTLQPTSQARTKAAGLTRLQLAMLALGLPAIALGTLAIVWSKFLGSRPHFTTWHGVSQFMLWHPARTVVVNGPETVEFDMRRSISP